MTALIFDTETHKLFGDLIEGAFIGIDILPTSGLIRTQTRSISAQWQSIILLMKT